MIVLTLILLALFVFDFWPVGAGLFVLALVVAK